MIDKGYVVKDSITKEYYCGMNKWDKQLRKATIYHSIRYANAIMKDSRFSNRTMGVVKVEIKEEV